MTWTHRLWSTGQLRQIDFLLISSWARAAIRNAASIDELDARTDHRGVMARVGCKMPKKKRWKDITSHGKWKMHKDEPKRLLGLMLTSFKNQASLIRR